MSATTASVRRVRAEEWEALRELRLRALADAPMAFGSTHAGESSLSDEVWRERARHGEAGSERVTFVAEREGRLVGLATGLGDDPAPGEVTLVGMFVDPAERGRGTGVALVEAVAEWARARGSRRMGLWVTESNAPARALYKGCGFELTGETEPLEHTPAVSEVRMVRHLLEPDAS